MADLKGLRVAILVENGFEEVELVKPRQALDEAGAKTAIVSPRSERVRAWSFTHWSDYFEVDVPLERARPEDFDALLLPGASSIPTSSGSSRRRSPSCRPSSLPASRWRRSATAPGP
jgi:hypothetical protein